MQPREAAAHIEAESRLPPGLDERFGGYGIMGLPFRSGHVLAMRRFPASSVGPGYTSVWHRAPDGHWTFYANVPPAMACTRFFGRAATAALDTDVSLRWTQADRFRVEVAAAGLEWEVELRGTAVTAAMNGFMGVIPSRAWRSPGFLSAMGAMAGLGLGAGRVGLTGTVPNGQRFVANPYRLWLVSATRALMSGASLGDPGPVRPQARLGGFWIPQRGIFALGRAYFDPFDAARHSPRTTAV